MLNTILRHTIFSEGCSMAQEVSCSPFTLEAQISHRPVYAGFVEDIVALGRFFSKYLGFELQASVKDPLVPTE
jgi:hypothetical protein